MLLSRLGYVGVPWDTKCSNIWLVFLNHPKNLIHRSRAKFNVLLLAASVDGMDPYHPR